MTSKEREAMQQALEALEELFHSNSTKVAVEKYNTAHNALREALAEQAEQEPVAEILVNDKDVIVLWHKTARQLGHQAKLYAAPARTKDLTDDELCEIEKPHLVNYRIPLGGQYDFARAVIAAYKEKNK